MVCKGPSIWNILHATHNPPKNSIIDTIIKIANIALLDRIHLRQSSPNLQITDKTCSLVFLNVEIILFIKYSPNKYMA